MITKINIKHLENDIYSITNSNSMQCQINYIDFTITQPPLQSSSFNNISSNVFVNSVQLKKLEIKINSPSPQLSFISAEQEYQNLQIIFNTIKNSIEFDVFKSMSTLGEKNRLTAPNKIYNFNINDINKKYKGDKSKVSKSIKHKFIGSSNYIATQGRLGPGQFISSNQKTYNYVFDNLEDEDIQYDKNNNILFGNSLPYIVNNLIDDDIIVIGRKNALEQPGVHCVILTDDNGDIHFNEVSSFASTEKVLIMYYKVFDIGVNTEYQYLNINTRTLSYYRNKKLKRIKELYGK